MGRCLTAAQEQRQHRRLSSIKKQQSTGRTVNTDRYDNWGRSRGTRNTPDTTKDTQTPSAPEKLLCVIDTTHPEMRDTAERQAELVNGALILRMIYGEDDSCEHCGTNEGYHIKGISAYSALCREHLAEQPGVHTVVESEEELNRFAVKPVEVTR